MYPPRSEKLKTKKQEKQRRLNRIWLMVNLTLITLIIVLGAYFYLGERTQQGSPVKNPSGVQSNPSGVTNGQGGQNTGLTSPKAQPENESEASDNLPTGDGVAEAEPNPDELELVNEPGSPIGGVRDDELLIHFAGDTIFSSKVAEKLEKEGYDYPYKYVQDLFQKDDLTILNLETPVTKGGQAAKNKQFVFKSSPKALASMEKAGVDAVNLANNHILDHGISGLRDTIKYLNQYKILHAGAGNNSQDAYAPAYIERKGIRIALFGFSRVMPEPSWAAGKTQAGVASVYQPDLAIKAIKAARKKADVVLVVAHWGKERTTVLEKHQKDLAHSFIDAGADLVVGGHPHVLQGLEKYKGKWIAYSTGNFIFTKSKDPKTWETAVFEVKCTRKGACTMQLIPYRTELGQPVPMNKQEGSKLLREIQSYSPGVKIGSNGEVVSLGAKKTGGFGTFPAEERIVAFTE